MIELPSGTVTFLFTDIEGSTDLAQQYPAEMPALLARHNAILREAIESNHGHVFQIIGDAFCAAFETAPDGLNAALQSQRMLQHETWLPTPIKVRMGLNTGSAQAGAPGELGGGYSGYSTLARVQRVMSAAHGGQILLSNSTAELVRDILPAGISVRDMGEHKLKGLLQLENLWQVNAPDLQQDFAPLQTLNVQPNNLPAALNRLVGRAHELIEVKQRLSQTRLLTLLGPGGTGKTRLALQAAGDLLADYDDHIYFVDLAPCRDTEAALTAIGRTIGIRESNGKPLLDELKEHIKRKKMLQLLDNFEQVTVAAPAMAELLRDCPELKMLVTSREALHVRGENVFPVPPLTLPPLDSKRLSTEQLSRCEAVQLFVERAQAVKPNFELTNDNAPAVAEICARLDGLPLAIELATARLNLFTPQSLAERLGDRLKLLRGGARDLPERHQTLRDTIDWSYEMLDAREQALFKLLAVFSGATLEAIEAVAGHLEQFKESDIFEAVSSLVDKSLIRQEETVDGEARLRMLETIREFATARLEEDAAFNTAARHAHATFFAEFTASQWIQLTSETRERAFSLLTIDLENIRAAWRYWADAGNLEMLSKFTDCLWLLYDARGWYHDTIGLTTDLLKVLSTTVSTPDRLQQEIMLQTSLARALLTTKGYTPEVEQAYAHALELCDKAGDVPQLFPVLRGLSFYYVFRTEYEKGTQMGERILKLAEHLNDPDMRAEGQLVLGYNLAFTTDLYGGLELIEQSIAGFDLSRQRMRRLGLGTNPGVVGLAASALLLWMAGFPDRGRKRMGEAVALSRKLDHPFSMAYAQFHFALINLWLGNIKVTAEYAQTLIDSAEEHEFPIWAAVGACLRGTALTIMGSIDEGVALIDRGIQASRGLNTPPIFWPSLLQLQAIVYGIAGKPIEGLRLLDEATRITLATLNHTAASEFFCTKGDLLLAIDPNNASEAEVWYQRAVDNAKDVKAPMFELRAALKLSSLWQAQGKLDQARAVLKTAYAKMTEGFNTYDLQQAQALLEELK
jgi:predicted ATPase/class 3 adenylate cyclase